VGATRPHGPRLAVARAGCLNDGVTLSHDELLAFADVRAVWGKGLSLVDAQLLGAALLSRGAMTIWTRDKTVKVAAEAMQIAYAEES
jgi:hypothetical protein